MAALMATPTIIKISSVIKRKTTGASALPISPNTLSGPSFLTNIENDHSYCRTTGSQSVCNNGNSADLVNISIFEESSEMAIKSLEDLKNSQFKDIIKDILTKPVNTSSSLLVLQHEMQLPKTSSYRDPEVRCFFWTQAHTIRLKPSVLDSLNKDFEISKLFCDCSTQTRNFIIQTWLQNFFSYVLVKLASSWSLNEVADHCYSRTTDSQSICNNGNSPDPCQGVPHDVHICGGCQNQFSVITSFISHIKVCPKRTTVAVATKYCSPVYPSMKPTSDLPISEEPTPGEDRQDTSQAVEAEQGASVSSQTTPILTDARSKEVTKYKKVTVMGVTKFCCTYEQCTFSTLYHKDLDRHYRIHTGEKPYHCWQCGKHFSRKDKLKSHQKAHKGEKPLKCLQCNYATSDNSSLIKHQRIHTGEKPYKCQICPYASRNGSQLIVHLRTHTGDKPFHCRLCHMKFKINSDLKRHTLLHTGEKPFVCPLCGYRCSIKGNLKAHMKNHVTESPLRCELCDFVTNSRKDLRAHDRLHQSRVFQCLQCNYLASTQSALNVHVRTHSPEKPFKCQYCNFTARQSGNVRTHIRKKHPEKLPSSPKSRKKVSSKNSLGQNKPVRPVCKKTFKCKICKSGFVRIDSLRCHLRQHQAEELLAQARLNADPPTSKETLQQSSDTSPSISHHEPEQSREVRKLTNTPDTVALTVVPPDLPQQPSVLMNNIQAENSDFRYSGLNFTDSVEASNSGRMNLLLNSSGPSLAIQPEYLLNHRNVIKDLNKQEKEGISDLTGCNNSIPHSTLNSATINTIITTPPTSNTNELGIFQLYQVPAGVGFVTLPVLPSASSQNTISSNMYSGLSEIDSNSLVAASSPTMLHLSGLGSNVQYLISQSPTKHNSETSS